MAVIQWWVLIIIIVAFLGIGILAGIVFEKQNQELKKLIDK